MTTSNSILAFMHGSDSLYLGFVQMVSGFDVYLWGGCSCDLRWGRMIELETLCHFRATGTAPTELRHFFGAQVGSFENCRCR